MVFNRGFFLFLCFALYCKSACGPMESEKVLEAGKHREGWEGGGGAAGSVCISAYVSYCSDVPVHHLGFQFALWTSSSVSFRYRPSYC